MSKGDWFRIRWLMFLAAGIIAGACGTPAAQAPLSASSPAGARVSTADELAELGSFEDRGAPNGMVIWLRVPAPGRDIPLLATLLGVGSMLDPSEILSHRLGASLSRSVDLSKPVDLTTSGLDDGSASLVLAAGIFEPSTFLSQVSPDFQVVHQSQGRWRLLPKKKPTARALECELWHAAKPVGARLVCATEHELIEQQGEFLMAKARTSVDRANFHAELPGSAARALLRKSADEETHKRADTAEKEDSDVLAGRALGQRWISDWARDLGGLSWDLTLQRNSVELSQQMGFARSDSVLSTSLAGRVGVPKPVPDAFWRLPSDSDAALYSEGAEPEPMRRQAASFMHQLRVAMESDTDYEFPPAVLDRAEENLRSLLMRGGAFELAYGCDLDQAARALNEAADRASDRGPRSGSADPALKKAQSQLGGWVLLGIDEDSRAYLQAIREALRFAADSSKYPRKKHAKAELPSPSNQTFRELPVPASAGLPADALHVVVRSEPNAKYLAAKAKPAPPAPSSYHLIAVPDAAQHLWFAFSSDENLAMARLRAVLSPESAKTLGSSEELRQLAKQPLAGLGFGTLAAVSGVTLSADSKPKVLESRSTLKELWALPKRGSTRVPLWITRAQLAGGERRMAANVRLTPDAIGDLLALFLANAAQESD